MFSGSTQHRISIQNNGTLKRYIKLFSIRSGWKKSASFFNFTKLCDLSSNFNQVFSSIYEQGNFVVRVYKNDSKIV